VLTPAATAEALCIYKGVNNARTTIRQEYADASWVVRARVLSATNGVVEAGKLDAGSPWTLYHLQVVHSYKGKPPQRIAFFTMRNSGGFYMDRPWVPLPRGHDLGGEYLLFLNPVAPYRGQPGLSAERPSSLTTAASLDRGVKFRPGRADCWHHSQLDAECPFSTHGGHSLPHDLRLGDGVILLRESGEAVLDVIMPTLIGALGVYWIIRARITKVASIGMLEFEKDQEPAGYWGVIVLYGIVVASAFGLAAHNLRPLLMPRS
jgi:hypothetical protein